MRAFTAVLLAASAYAVQALALDPPSCAVPDSLLFVDNSLNRVTTVVGKQHQLVETEWVGQLGLEVLEREIELEACRVLAEQ